MPEVLLGFGGNLGDPAAAIRAALDRLVGSELRIHRRSALYRTPAWGKTDQPEFVNMCALAQTNLSARALLRLTQTVERDLGRIAGERWGPRTLDIDLLDYDNLVLAEPGLTLPHPRMLERAFVLVPLAEVAPDRVIAGRTVAEWAATVDQAGIVRLPDT